MTGHREKQRQAKTPESLVKERGLAESFQRKQWTIWSDMDGPIDCHTDWNKSDREIKILYDITCMLTQKKKEKKNSTNKLVYKTEVEFQM